LDLHPKPVKETGKGSHTDGSLFFILKIFIYNQKIFLKNNFLSYYKYIK